MTPLFANFRRQARQAFTLTEVMLAFALMALAAAILVPNFSGMIAANREREAKGKAAMLGLAKTAYVRDYGQLAFTTWLNTPGDNERFLLLKEELGPGCSATSLTEYSPTGYTFVLGDLPAAVAIAGPDGPVTY